jgi:hypothetical protein
MDMIKMGLIVYDTRYNEFDVGNKVSEGDIMILDMKGLTIRHFLKMMRSFSATQFYIKYLQESSPVRIVEAHIFNASPVVNRFYAIIRPLMRKELLDVMHIHSGDFESLHKTVPKELLPTELGGTSGMTMEENFKGWLQKIEKNR